MRAWKWTGWLGIVGWMWCLAAGVAMGASPSLSVILPRGVQRGGERVLTFSGARLADAEEIFFYEPGVEVRDIEADGPNRLRVTVAVAPDCRLGEHVAQVRTRSGISDFRTFFVGALPDVEEKEPNSDFESPQPIPLNVTVNGVVQNEDVDYFVVEAKQGQRLSVEIEAIRLGTALFDPYIAILNSKRFELAAADDVAFGLQDAVASIVVPEDGRYVILVRDSAYGGGNNFYYRLHVGTFPRPTAVYPAGGKKGESIEVRFLGDPTGEIRQTFELPSEADENFGLLAQDAGGLAPSANPFRLFDHGNVLEQEPNNSLAQATPAELPLALNGIIESEGDVDCFRFQAKKGQRWEVECYARRLRSPLDPVMYLYRASGQRLLANDDSRGPDSYFRFDVPEDGEYVLMVRDHLGRGGSDFIYRVELTPVTPALTVGIPRVDRYSQYRQTIVVPRGNRFGTLISASRENFSGELVLEGAGLPEGIRMIAEKMPANLNVMPVVFEADPDAPIAGRLVDFTARHVDPSRGIRGGFRNRADLVLGPPNNTLYRYRDVNLLPVAVVEEVPFQLEIVEPKVPLVRDGTMRLKIVAHRKDDFKSAIRVEFPFRPPGVGAASSITIPEGKNEAEYPLSASGNAQVGAWKVYAIGSADVGGAVWVSSQLATLNVAQPYVTFTMQRAACEQGQHATIYCQLNHVTPFEGTATAQLVGLPPKVTAPVLEFTKDTKELVFEVQTDKTSPVGKHRNVICQVTIVQNGEPIVSRAGTVELQIDKPLVVQAAPKPQAVAQKPAPQPAKKPLSRLEQLRRQAQQAAALQSATPPGGN